MVTVVDGFNFFKDFGTAETLKDRTISNTENDERTIVNLLVDQVEFANVIILNKIDLISKSKLNTLKASLTKLNPVATIIISEYGKIDVKKVLNTGLFHYEEAENSAGWMRELEGAHTPETEEYGITSFVLVTTAHFILIDFTIILPMIFLKQLSEVKDYFGLHRDRSKPSIGAKLEDQQKLRELVFGGQVCRLANA